MAYTPTNWTNDVPPALNATNLNHLTDELKAQALVQGISHSLPTWINGGPPAVSDPAPLNEMERVVDLVAASLSLAYTPTVWQEGWTPARNATRLNHLEVQAQANRVAIDTPPPTGAFYVADFEDGTLNAIYSQQESSSGRIAAVATPLNIAGTYSMRFLNGTPDSDVPAGTNRQATEVIVQPKIVRSFFGGDVSLQGRETWMTWKFLLDPNYEEPLDTWGLITQLWTNGLFQGSPCFALENPRISPNARAQLQVTIRGGTGGVSGPESASNVVTYLLQNPVQRGVVYHIKLYKFWSSTGSIGSSNGVTKLWWYIQGNPIPGAPAVNHVGPNFATSYPNDPEHKMGIYRSKAGITRDSYLIVDDISYYTSDPGNF